MQSEPCMSEPGAGYAQSQVLRHWETLSGGIPAVQFDTVITKNFATVIYFDTFLCLVFLLF